MNRLHLEIPGEPVAKGRARHSVRGGIVRTYTPAKTRSYEAEIRAIAAEQWGQREPLGRVPIWFRATAYRSIPASFSRKQRARALAGDLLPLTKPDSSNCLKAAEDALEGVVYSNDSCIISSRCDKYYSARPRLEIVVEWAE